MSIDMYLELSLAQADSVAAMVDQALSALDQLDSAINRLLESGSELKGMSYDSLRDHVETVIVPHKDGARRYLEEVKEAVRRFPEAYQEEVGPESLRQSDLEAQLEQCNAVISDGQALLAEMQAHPVGDHAQERIGDMQASLDIAKQAKAKIQDKLDRLLAFDASSPRIFEGLDELAASLKAMSQFTQAAWNPQTKTFASVDFRGMDLMNSSQIQELTRDVLFVLRYDVHRPEGMSDAEFKEYVSTLRTQVQSLESDGWTKKAIKDGYIDTVNVAYDPNKEMSIATQLGEYFNNAHTFGSGIFQKMWGIDYQTAKNHKDSAAAEKLLGIAMKYTGMPQELDGSAEQTQAILDKMSDSLAPDDDFWDDFAGTVQVAYPDKKGANALGDKGGNEALKQKVHQFRYVISAQQAQWVRDWARERYGNDISDEQALAAYLNDGHKSNYDFDDTARLHNKVTDNGVYPGGKKQVNYKILSKDFHTEFIISEDGSFVNEIDPEKDASENQNGVVNGASFNYANDGDEEGHNHWDVETPSKYDPEFRTDIIDNGGDKFRSPDMEDYKDSKNEIFGFKKGNDNQSTYDREQAQKDNFKEKVGEE
ncbi:hypothetical cytosolic protein [Streptococcus criceti]|uniref:LXG domain-containing protein n=1 Tax=Streptococcus criceti HS-6 TaxID=873449 RepID=G5JNA4_STRCG|nr:DUF3114 domain-containing protein [Streptococcus criceti]EHI74380.1 hypothetical protein STRCR_0141 [Streptococcus criceti HS-6]SUN41653.1 hypothetical cytosolic protein [Streptococcus criceti]